MSIQNLLIPDTKKDWAKIYCKELNADDLNIDNLETTNLKVDNIDEKTLNNGVIINSDLKVDNIDEKTLNNGVIINSDLKVDNIDEKTLNNGVIINSDLKVDNIYEKTLNNGVIINSDLKVDNILYNNQTKIKIQKNESYIITQEFGRHRCDFVNVGDQALYIKGSNFITTNTGAVDYVPQLAGDLFNIPNAGIYSINCSSFIDNTVVSGAAFSIRIYNTTTNEVLSINSGTVNNQNAVGQTYSLSTCFVGYLDAGVDIEIGMRQITSPGGLNLFKATILLSKLK
jgi:hypothetical protein